VGDGIPLVNYWLASAKAVPRLLPAEQKVPPPAPRTLRSSVSRRRHRAPRPNQTEREREGEGEWRRRLRQLRVTHAAAGTRLITPTDTKLLPPLQVFILCNDDNHADFVQWANTPKVSGGFPVANILSNGAAGNQRSGLFGDVDIFLQQTGGVASDLVVRAHPPE
jgi:hypothetical protein